MTDTTEEVLQMIRRQLRRKNVPGTEALYGRAVQIDESVRELSLRQFNAKYVLRVRRENEQGAEATATVEKHANPARLTETSRRQIRNLLLKLARDVLRADRAEIVDLVEGVDRYVDRAVVALKG